MAQEYTVITLLREALGSWYPSFFGGPKTKDEGCQERQT